MNEEYITYPFCGGKMLWSQTEMASERLDEYEGDEIATVNYYRCSVCGRDYEIVDPQLEERKTKYNNYWHEQGT